MLATIQQEKVKCINEYIKFDILSKMKTFKVWILINERGDEINNLEYIYYWIPDEKLFDFEIYKRIRSLSKLVKINDILGFKEKYEAITNYNFVNSAIEYYVGNYHQIFSRKKFDVDFLMNKTRKMLNFFKKIYLQGESFEQFLQR
ncbi:hypothetical protein [Spiroplasma endosymbiont of Dilophus febrilis]|uniref:hypothetical protein n=1 Tax=Spiroplasma endosymbiont of Dilophus febrilis TaxID=3066292 RepID=UPI00313A9ADB